MTTISRKSTLPALVLTGLVTVTAPALVSSAPSAEASAPAVAPLRTDRPLVIGHRGAAGYRPEHTLASYELAARMGADFIEPDLVSTKDHVLVTRHENEISGTTDVAEHPEFADRKTTKTVDGKAVTGWFTEDFTLAELRTLRATERLPGVRQENTIYNGRYQVPTFDEVLRLRDRLSHELHRTIGVYPETKHPTYFRSIGLDLETPMVAAVRRAHLDREQAPIFIQSFELTNLLELREKQRVRAPLVFLTSAKGQPFDLTAKGDPRTYADLLTAGSLKDLSKVINGIGPDKNQVIPRKADGTLGTPTSLVADAHAAGLKVHPYTFRNENQFMPVEFRNGTSPNDYGKAINEQVRFLRTGIDGLFTDNADTGVVARQEYLDTK
ncbi:glycerophosphoryl diester phosphodiesterase [Pedococcus cremeus]|uniref:glycerophosphodiester phosphodiesterase n=1 Tax=Pedococcus cremeus TaxID=587636 RepID=A0A1H9V573_9MICO|nr:glycerophosphodiester phosphodiesterase [Pedococcus cremeus]SES16822.1 glycerophosphoryl diester phosphodiesterase [Pedococcus cremeus]